MKITNEELWHLVRASEWLYDEDDSDVKNKPYVKLHNKIMKFYKTTGEYKNTEGDEIEIRIVKKKGGVRE